MRGRDGEMKAWEKEGSMIYISEEEIQREVLLTWERAIRDLTISGKVCRTQCNELQQSVHTHTHQVSYRYTHIHQVPCALV